MVSDEDEEMLNYDSDEISFISRYRLIKQKESAISNEDTTTLIFIEPSLIDKKEPLDFLQPGRRAILIKLDDKLDSNLKIVKPFFAYLIILASYDNLPDGNSDLEQKAIEIINKIIDSILKQKKDASIIMSFSKNSKIAVAQCEARNKAENMILIDERVLHFDNPTKLLRFMCNAASKIKKVNCQSSVIELVGASSAKNSKSKSSSKKKTTFEGNDNNSKNSQKVGRKFNNNNFRVNNNNNKNSFRKRKRGSD